MFYKLNENQRIFAEITNPVHGGLGWDFGLCLWSPSKNKVGGDSWALMRKVKPGDLIIHLLKRSDKEGYKFSGVSLADSNYLTVHSIMDPRI